MSRRRGPRLSALPIVVVIVLLLVGTLATTLAFPAASPPPPPSSDLPGGALPSLPDITAPPTETPFGRYPPTAESGLIGSCVSGIDPNTVPGPIAQAFCVCTVNRYEQLYPTYDEFQRASGSGAINDTVKTAVANQCARQIVGG
ncbi:MAG TPA: hypothetical protein VGT60_03555 [Candidatus Limnocylindria bacterium]|nr:hypothetical protein [Candidatus Limnocylindria bacterium]